MIKRFKKWLESRRKPRIPAHPDVVLCQYRNGVLMADNRRRELLFIQLSDIDFQWKIEVVGRF